MTQVDLDSDVRLAMSKRPSKKTNRTFDILIMYMLVMDILHSMHDFI